MMFVEKLLSLFVVLTGPKEDQIDDFLNENVAPDELADVIKVVSHPPARLVLNVPKFIFSL
jgi:hypothetical protein